MTLQQAKKKARDSAIRNKELRYVVYDGPQDGPHGGYQVATEEDMQTFFHFMSERDIKHTYDSTGAEDLNYTQ